MESIVRMSSSSQANLEKEEEEAKEGSSPNSKDTEHCTLLAFLHPFLRLQNSPPSVVGRNLALRKPTYQSSYSALTGGPPDKAVDGKCSGVWSKGSCTHTDYERNPWWYVDLGESCKIYSGGENPRGLLWPKTL
ncbi:hypothetical protein Chor_010594 [Crotalus horridus]